ncbi:arginase family protein [Streptosporangium vulgare]|uniref:arginase family protein n=1 Tax=Streptosporangium vulgare TaxID=46190 RepID=UPI0031E4326C
MDPTGWSSRRRSPGGRPRPPREPCPAATGRARGPSPFPPEEPVPNRYGPQFGPDITFLGVERCSLEDPESYAGADVVIVGAPFDGGTSHRPGARFGPQAIRMTDYLPHDGSRPQPGAAHRRAARPAGPGRGRRRDAARRHPGVAGRPGGRRREGRPFGSRPGGTGR